MHMSAPQFPKSHRWGSRNIAEVTMEMHKRHPKTKMHISMGWNQTITMVCIPYHGTATVSKKQAIPHPRNMQLRHTGMKNVIQVQSDKKKMSMRYYQKINLWNLRNIFVFLIRTSIQIQEKTEEPQEAIDVALFTKAEITEVRIKSIQVFLRFYFKMKALSAYINGENNNHLYECLLQVWMFLGHPLIERVVSSDVGANKTLSI